MPHAARRLLGLLLLALLVSTAQAQDTSHALQPIDVFDLEYATDPQIAPDGAQIVYERTRMDIMTDRRRAQLWRLNADGTGHRPLVTTDAHSPRWSPSGDRLAYLAEHEDQQQIFVRWMNTGAAAPITHVTESPGEIAWSPSGDRLAFSMFVPADPEPLVTPPPQPEGAEWAKPPMMVDDVQYRADGAGYLEDGHSHYFIVPAEGGTPRQITHAPYDHGDTPVWTPDGAALLFSANRHENAPYDPLNTEIYRVSLDDGTVTALTRRQGPDHSPAISPDGSQIAYLGFDDREQGYQLTHLYVMDADGSNKRMLLPDFDRSIQNPTWSADGQGLYFQYDDAGNTKIGFVTLDGARRVLADDVGGTTIGRPYASGSYSVADNGRFAFTHTRPTHPADVATGTRGGDASVQRLTRLNADLFDQKQLATVEPITYTSSYDGREIEGWIAKPPGFNPSKQYPLILEIHGGPFSNYGDRFSTEVQLYAAAGYVVLYTNPRGSTSYGAEFGNLIHHAYPSQDYDDLMSGVDAVLERGYVDPDRLYVTGGSGGGVLTAWIVGKTDRFRAAVSAKPVINWYSWALTADMYVYGTKYWFPGLPWNHRDHYMNRSPISLVDSVSTPTMLLTGTDDYRTPMSESEQFYQALKLRRVPSALVRVPDAGHGIVARPSHLIAKVQYILGWFDRYAP